MKESLTLEAKPYEKTVGEGLSLVTVGGVPKRTWSPQISK